MDNIKTTGNVFVDKLNLYQSANSDPESLKKNFVVRVTEFDTITGALKSKKKKDPLQHELILGRRGSGKSTLLKRIEIEINENKKLNKKYIPVNLAEEQAGIYRLSDLWYESLDEIQRRTEEYIELEEFSEFETEREYTIYLYDKISELLDKTAKKAVLLLDNVDRIFENFKDDGHLLRETLINHNNVQIIGASTRMDEHFWRYDQPFYDFFRVHHLEALTFEEINTLLNHWSKIMDLPQLKDFAIKNRGKIEAIRILTDGLPRTLQFFIRLLLTEKNAYGFHYIKKIMDEATPLYQERLNNLTSPQRKIVLEMAFIWEATSTKQLINRVRLQSKLVSAYLKQLISFGIVEKISTGTKNNLYRLSERFFNMWLIVTQGNPEQKRKARYLTIFIENWYSADEIKNLAEKHLAALKNKQFTYDKARPITKALAQSKFITTDTRDELIDSIQMLAESKVRYGDLPEKYQDLLNKIRELANQNKYKKALKKAGEIENEADGLKFYIMGYLYNKLYNSKEAEKYHLKAIEKGHLGAIFNLANLYREQGKEDEAEKYYLRAIEKGDTNAMYNLANLYFEQGKNKEAEKYYLLAIDKGNISAMYNLANLYNNQGKNKEAEKYYLLAIAKGHINAMNNLALLYKDQGKEEKAEKYYLKAIEKGYINAMNNLAILYLNNNKNPKKALELIQENNKIDSDFISRQLEFIIEIWNNIFEDVEAKMKYILDNGKDEDLSAFFEILLYLGQTNLVLSYFESEEYGKSLRDKYILLYYALLIVVGKKEQIQLKIPQEVMPTVEAMVKKIQEMQEVYL